MHIHRYERWWMTFGIAMLAVFLTTIVIAAVVDDINPPSGRSTIDPAKVSSTPPFDKPGVRKRADGTYEAYYVAQIFSFSPQTVTLPVGAKVDFFVTTPDVVHGFQIARTDVNMMVVPGWVNESVHTFRRAGTYLVLCNEYCGIGHQNMFAKIEVK